jgi:CHAT domain-containing protein/outer membrane protein assembly factor BamD (BamD/ComL family)
MLLTHAVQTLYAILSRQLYRRVLALTILACVGNPPVSLAAALSNAEAASANQLMDRGMSAFQRGDFEQAAQHWSEAERRFAAAENPLQRSAALVQLAQAKRALGQYRDALQSLESALALAETSRDQAQRAVVLAAIGDTYIATGPFESAQKYLQEALQIAKQSRHDGLAATALNNLGNLAAAQGKYPDANAAYLESAALAKRANNGSLVATAKINAATASIQDKQYKEAKGRLDEAAEEIQSLKPSQDVAMGLINIGLGYADLRAALPEARDGLLLLAHRKLSEAGSMADGLGDRRSGSYAWGHLGRLYEEENRYEEALQLSRRAIFAAQQINAPESLYRWEWQTGRLLAKQGNVDDAINAYRRAVRTLQSIRPELSISYGATRVSFRETVGPVYFELVDLLLKQAASLKDPGQVAPYLVEARESVELFKAAELRDYFRDDCVDTALSKVTQLETVAKSAVVIYPIILAERTELLASLPSGLKRISVAVSAEALTDEVRQLRRMLEKRTTREYLPHAQKLYDWLIRPLEADLATSAIDTLVFVPDGALRTIPMAALHDGKQFLIAKYAMAITPSLSLSDPRPLARENMKVLAVGVTEAVQGFSALPNVDAELQQLKTLLGSQNLVNDQFLAANLEKKLKEEQFNIVHIASHGEFGNDVENTFLLTFDDKLSLDRLNQMVGVFRFRDDPLGLITLSACDTAAGDDRAALGLAGMAIKAGARSALATLWNISDQATVGLVLDFYRELKNPAMSRAVALQKAQLKLIENPRYEHPGYWSAFLMINNWL